MMSKLQFSRLRHGDVILWGRWPNVIKRTVIEGPVDIAKSRGTDPINHLHIVLSIRRRSWTGRAKTGYTWNDVKRNIRLSGMSRRKTVISTEEMDRLKHIRFNPAKEYLREIKREARYNKRVGRKCPFKPLPLPRT
jgi:hypothetical protein